MIFQDTFGAELADGFHQPFIYINVKLKVPLDLHKPNVWLET